MTEEELAVIDDEIIRTAKHMGDAKNDKSTDSDEKEEESEHESDGACECGSTSRE